MKRNPKAKSITAEQEDQLAAAERLHMRADIFTSGVAAQLNQSVYGHDLLSECARALQDAAGMHNEAFAIQSEIDHPLYRRNKIHVRRTRTSTEPKQSARSKS